MATTTRNVLGIWLTAFLLGSLALAQSGDSSSAIVPRLVNYWGKAIDSQGKVITGVAATTFSIYKEQYEGAPLWMETQNVTADTKGNYTVQLGASSSEGLPLDLFTSGEARWLGVRVNGGEEQPRVLLLSVPYALKAADAQTLGGLPSSAFQLAGAANATTARSGVVAVATPSPTFASPATSADVTTSGGTVNALPLFTTATNVQSSILTQTGSGTTGKIGINTTTPATLLDVNGGITVRGTLGLATTGTATATAGKNSQPVNFMASAYNSSTKAAVAQKFEWQAEAAGNNTSAPSGTVNLLYSSGTATPAETGLKINNKGLLTFAAGQTFPGTGSGTITGLTAGTGLSGGGTGGNVTLGINTSVVPQLASANNFTVNQTVTNTTTECAINCAAVLAIDNTSIGAGALFGSSLLGYGVWGSGNTYGVYGYGGNYGVYGFGESYGLYGYAYGDYSPTYGVYAVGETGVVGMTTGGANAGVYAQAGDGGWAVDAYNPGNGTGVLAGSATGYAGWFNGNLEVNGNLIKGGGSFKIDHPLDPANKYLSHSFVESPDMKNIYDGVVTTDAQGDAVVNLPEWFETLNRNFRYQLTVIGQFAQAIVATEITDDRFSIKTDKPHVKVSWQVTGIRQDAWANAHRIPVEEEKSEVERGFYLHPELYGAPEEKGILWATAPKAMKQWKEARIKAATSDGNEVLTKPRNGRPQQLPVPLGPRSSSMRGPAKSGSMRGTAMFHQLRLLPPN
jgi:trimeric autotransporter adhesin